MDKTMTMEDAFKRLDQLLEILEKEDCSLEDTFAYYKEGVELVHFCQNRIDGIEKKLQILEGNEDNDECRDNN